MSDAFLSDIKFVSAPEGELPTPANSVALHEADSEGRGSLVFFNQASLFQSSETDSATLAEARRAGRSTTTDYGEDAQAAFSNSMFFHSLHDPSVATPRPPLP